ncbi:unnamed protein product [Medioppia subpectinata]|uniref:Cytochrome P450 n=1 Tax=Medioppia subpectinata TaxID=1979941 RepID=A0A7R9KGN1_9ACAR|nr:unnamed protein product [Medioppia subpectinata]CAG2102994.1 unnamed protein product [Medioppia subpectinata]
MKSNDILEVEAYTELLGKGKHTGPDTGPNLWQRIGAESKSQTIFGAQVCAQKLLLTTSSHLTLVFVHIYRKPSLRVAEPALVKQILVQKFTLFKNREAPSCSKATLMSKMLIRAPYEDWRRIRAIAGPAFTGGKLKRLYPLIDRCCRDLVDRLDSRVAANGSPVGLRPLISEYIMSALGQCAFSTKVNTDPTHLFTTEPEGYLSVSLLKVLVANVLPACLVDNPVANSLAKWWHSDYLYHRVFTAGLMADRRCDDADKRHDFLQFLMKGSHRTDGAAHPDVTGITDEEIFAQCFLFFIAGYDPTANTVSHALLELALNPDIQERLREETAMNGNRDMNYEILSRLPLLDAVVSETLRKYPPLVRVEREAVEDVVLTDDTQGLSVRVEKGVVVEVPVYAIHHDPDYYPDPFAFKPDRFLPENRHNIKPYTYLPFGDGPRNCIGMRFGLLMTKLALVNIIQHFHLYHVTDANASVKFKRGNFVVQSEMSQVGFKRAVQMGAY